MKAISKIVNKIKRVIEEYRLKVVMPWEILYSRFYILFYGRERGLKIFQDNLLPKKFKKFHKIFFKSGIWDFNGAKLPDYQGPDCESSIYWVYMDSLFVFCEHNDNYNSVLIDKLDNYLPEGTYGYTNNDIDVVVKEGDVVIDAGAWIGDFSAYASVKGASAIYAFEPSQPTLDYLKETQAMNKNIHIVEKGLGDQTGFFSFSLNMSSESNRISQSDTGLSKIAVTTIDDFVTENKIEKIDFIKSDIEGFERYMLMGAQKTLKEFAPKLAICTYHLPDDPEVLAKIILEANPNYVIVQKRKKLYAMVKN